MKFLSKDWVKSAKGKQIAITCEHGNTFLGMAGKIDTERKLKILYYKAQGCSVSITDNFKFSESDCKECDLSHEFEEMIEEIKDEAVSEYLGER